MKENIKKQLSKLNISTEALERLRTKKQQKQKVAINGMITASLATIGNISISNYLINIVQQQNQNLELIKSCPSLTSIVELGTLFGTMLMINNYTHYSEARDDYEATLDQTAYLSTNDNTKINAIKKILRKI